MDFRRLLTPVFVFIAVAGLIATAAPVASQSGGPAAGADGAGESASDGVPCPPSGAETVGSVSGLHAALSDASSGDTVYLDPSARLDIGRETFDVERGVTLSGGRGCGGADGALLTTSSQARMSAAIDAVGGRVTGIRLAGPFLDKTSVEAGQIHDTARKGIRATDSVVDHSVVRGWSWAAINAIGTTRVVQNTLTDTRYTGLGYGVVVGEGAVEILGNTFARNRHAIAGIGGADSSYISRGNVFGSTTSHAVDMHGTGENGMGGVAGGRVVVESNTFTDASNPAVFIRGTPSGEAIVRNNALAHDSAEAAIQQFEGASGMQVTSNQAGVTGTLGENASVGAAAATVSGDTSIPAQVSTGGGGLGLFSVESIISELTSLLMEGFQWILEQSMTLILGTPVIENDGWLGIFGEPTGRHAETYDAVVGGFIYPYMIPLLGVAIMLSAAIVAFGGIAKSYKASGIAFACGVGILAFFFSWTYVSALHNITNAFVMGIAPSPEELTNSLGSVTKSAAGPLIVAFGAALLGWTEGLALLLIYGARRALLETLIYVFPFAVFVAYFGPHRYIRILGSVFIWQYHGLVFMTVPVAIAMRIAYHLGWDFTAEGFGNAMISLGLFAGAIFMPLFISGSCLLAPFLLQRYSRRGADAAETGAGWASNRRNDDGVGGGGGQARDGSQRRSHTTNRTEPAADGGSTVAHRRRRGGRSGDSTSASTWSERQELMQKRQERSGD